MELISQRNGSTLTVQVVGRVDTLTAPEMERGLTTGLGDAERLVLNLSEMEYISSAGLRVLLGLHRRMSKLGGLVLTAPNETVSEILEITGFVDMLNIE